MANLEHILQAAAGCVGEPTRDANGYGYCASVPYHDTEPHGACTVIRAGGRQQILAMLRGHKASVALALAAGAYDIPMESAYPMACEALVDCISQTHAGDRHYPGDWRSAVRALVRQHQPVAVALTDDMIDSGALQ